MRIVLILGAVGALTARDNANPLPLTNPYTATAAAVAAYTGAITDSVSGMGSLTVIINSSTGSSSSGTWVEVFPGQKSTTRFISGTLDGSSYRATVSDCQASSSAPCSPNCQQALTGTLTSTVLSGAYAEVPGDA